MWHLTNLNPIKLLQLLQIHAILGSHKVNGHTFATKAPTSPNTMQIALKIGGQVVVDHEIYLLNVNATGQEVSRNQDTRRSSTEVLHDLLPSFRWQISVNNADSEVAVCHLLTDLNDLLLCIGVNHSLLYVYVFIEVYQCFEFVLFMLYGHIVLIDTLQG